MSKSPIIAKPLQGIRVLDLTQFLSGPFCTQMLGDLGAEVIKVESPAGDMTRQLPPYFVGKDSAYFISVNRNKKSLVLDLKTKKGVELLKRLVLASDVVVENFRPGVLERLGVDHQELSGLKSSLVWCSISGFGQDGPYQNRPAYDMIVQAMAGVMSLTGEPEGSPVRTGVPIGDLAAGLYATIGLLAQLIERLRTGEGGHIDISMLDAQVSLLSYQAAYHLHSGVVPGRQGCAHDAIPTYRSFSCGDGKMLVTTANTEKMWRSLCQVLGLDELAQDPRFLTNEVRYQNRQALWVLLEAAFLKRAAADWVDAMIAAEIPAAVIADLEQSLSDEQVLHRSMVLDLHDEKSGLRARVAGNPLKWKGRQEAAPGFPPGLGADSDAVLADVLGLSQQELSDLRAQRVVV